MRIGFEASGAVGRRPTGVAVYIKNFIRSMADLGSGHRFRIFYRASRLGRRAEWFRPGDIPAQVYFGSFFPFFRNLDIIHGLDAFVPDWRGVRRIVTFHDILPLLYTDEEITPPAFRLKKEKDYRRVCDVADRIITVSDSTRRDLIERFELPSEKVTRVYPGIDADFFKPSDAAEVERVRRRYGLGERYLLFVGTISGRKNTARLVEAFARSEAVADHRLVLAGSISYMGDLTLQAIERNRLGEKVLIPGYVDHADLPALYTGAAGFLFPTVYEGFGFPILESLLCGTPVLAGDAGSAPEIGGRFVLNADPFDVDSIAAGIDELLMLKGFDAKTARAHAEGFSWRRTAARTLEIYGEETAA